MYEMQFTDNATIEPHLSRILDLTRRGAVVRHGVLSLVVFQPGGKFNESAVKITVDILENMLEVDVYLSRLGS